MAGGADFHRRHFVARSRAGGRRIGVSSARSAAARSVIGASRVRKRSSRARRVALRAAARRIAATRLSPDVTEKKARSVARAMAGMPTVRLVELGGMAGWIGWLGVDLASRDSQFSMAWQLSQARAAKLGTTKIDPRENGPGIAVLDQDGRAQATVNRTPTRSSLGIRRGFGGGMCTNAT